MENGQNEGVAKLLDVEKTSDVYMTELCEKMKDLKGRLDEEKVISIQLQEILCSLEGRVSVHYQRSEELGTDDFKEMMNRATDELVNAKEESEDLSTEIFNGCNYMMREIKNETGKVDESRIQFKNTKSMQQSVGLESARIEHLKTEILNVENEIRETNCAGEELMRSMQTYEEIDGITLQFMRDLEYIDDEITGLGLLNGRRSESSALPS